MELETLIRSVSLRNQTAYQRHQIGAYWTANLTAMQGVADRTTESIYYSKSCRYDSSTRSNAPLPYPRKSVPFKWTPQHCAEEVFPCRKPIRRTRRSTGPPAVLTEQRLLHLGFEGTFIGLRAHEASPRTKRARSRRSISYGVMHFVPRPMQASGILILRVDADGTSCVTTV